MKYLIIGLGNPGPKYHATRHNIGFMVLDELTGNDPTAFAPDRYAERATLKHRGRTLILVKPTTFMNLSGKAVQYWLQQEKLTPDKLLVLVDDIALPYGHIRLRLKGSDGGHNGLKDIQAKIGTTKYPRLRLGVGDDFPPGGQVDYVLSPFNPAEKNQLPSFLEKAAKAVQAFAFHGPQHTMTHYNGPAVEE